MGLSGRLGEAGSIIGDPGPTGGQGGHPSAGGPVPAASPYLCLKLHLSPYLQLPFANPTQGWDRLSPCFSHSLETHSAASWKTNSCNILQSCF